ncbi:MAG TPA: heterodisulfide reductase-related iron-sulfur binding cluster [Methylomirabilota bacterium]|nr:heterodisulfide reductase-related iron-sulfur binding cluster [Methylomirabilota bacterium]
MKNKQEYAAYFSEIALTHDMLSRPEDRRWRLTPAAPGERHEIVLYLGCNVLRTSHMVQTVTAIFDRLGLDYVAVGGATYCCGIQHHTKGDTEDAAALTRRTVTLLSRWQPREVVMWCPSCIFFFDEVQHYPLPFPFRHAAEFLVEQLPRLSFTQEVRRTVALHAHVRSEARRREGAAGRRLLEAVPGLTFVPVEPQPRFGRICTVNVQREVGPEAWNDLVRDEIARAHAGGADTLATMYHGCQRLLCAFEAAAPLAIEHYLSVFARGLGIEFEDTYKKWTLSGDPEAILADATPCMEANGVDAGRARAFVERTFVPLQRLAGDGAPS